MRLFLCPRCSAVVYFENRACESCGSGLGYVPGRNAFNALDPKDDAWWPSEARAKPSRFCANAEYDACNWLIPADSSETLCLTCRHNQMVPDLSNDENLRRWRKLEFAHHHLFYGLARLRLPLATRASEPNSGLAFEFLADGPVAGHVLTGHADGVITLNLAEADDATREQLRTEMGEPYRTLLGHFRHEIGHYYWDRLVRDSERLDDFRALFGDETRDYDAALRTYYADGPPDWPENFVSAYANAHPWEDFAETWAHYMHITDTLEMARAYGVQVNPTVTDDPALSAEVDFDPFTAASIEQLVSRWRPIAIAVNSINRCMGQPDLYPFVLTAAVIAKLGFIHDLIHAPARGDRAETSLTTA